MYKNMSFAEYRKEVDRHTQFKRRSIVCEFGEEVDHKLQVKVAYKLGIEPRVVAEPINLRPLEKELNAARQDIIDDVTVAAIKDLCDNGFLPEELAPKTYKKIEFGKLPQVLQAVKTLSEKRPHAQVYVSVGALASIEPIENQRNHESRYPKQLNHFDQIGQVRPKHTKFTVTVFKENGEYQYRLTDGNTRKHNLLHGYIQLLGLEFPEEVAVDLEWSESKEQAAEDSLLHDAISAAKNTTDLVNGIRRQIGLNEGILIKTINEGEGILPISFAVAQGTPYGMKSKNDWMNCAEAIQFAYPLMQTVINDFICRGKFIGKRPKGMVDWYIASLCRLYSKHGEKSIETIVDFIESLSSRNFGERTPPGPYSKRLQPIECIQDELLKYEDKDISVIHRLKKSSFTGELPRRVMPNGNSDSNIKIHMGLTLYALEASMNGKTIKENLYEEFCGNVKDLDADTLRSQAATKAEMYFDNFWNENVNTKAA